MNTPKISIPQQVPPIFRLAQDEENFCTFGVSAPDPKTGKMSADSPRRIETVVLDDCDRLHAPPALYCRTRFAARSLRPALRHLRLP